MAPLLRFFPPRVQQSLYYRLYNPPPERIRRHFTNARLRYAPGVAMDLVFGDVLHGSIAILGFYELDLTRRVIEVGRQKGGLMVDVGANVGYFSLLWLSQRPENRCVLFEPVPRNIELIKTNLRKNGFDDRAEVRPVALGREAGEMHFDLGPKEQTGWGGLRMGKSVRSIRIPVARLDEEIKERVELLKIDTEGADAWVLEGGRSLLEQQTVREIHFEGNALRALQLGIGEEAAPAFLRSVGYRVVQSGDNYLAVPA